MKEIWNDIKERFKKGDILTRLIYINAGVFILSILFSIIWGLVTGNWDNSQQTFHSLTGLPINNFFEVLIKPYSIVTHMFVHDGFWHLLVNMLVLYFLGKIFLNYFSSRQFFGLYMLAGLSAALFLLITTSISPLFTSPNYAVGASAAVMSIVVGITAYTPNTIVKPFGIFPIKLMWIGIFIVLQDLIKINNSDVENLGGTLAHLVGAGVGYWFASAYKQGRDITIKINRYIDKVKGLFNRKAKMKVVYNQSKVRTMSDDEYNANQKVSQAEIDAILDKISASGYSSLTKREKDILFKYSNKNN
jgi:membrane associated rhomboid family serine protease